MNGFAVVPFVGLTTIDGLSNVGPKRVLNWTIKKVASYSLDLVCKGKKNFNVLRFSVGCCCLKTSCSGSCITGLTKLNKKGFPVAR